MTPRCRLRLSQRCGRHFLWSRAGAQSRTRCASPEASVCLPARAALVVGKGYVAEFNSPPYISGSSAAKYVDSHRNFKKAESKLLEMLKKSARTKSWKMVYTKLLTQSIFQEKANTRKMFFSHNIIGMAKSSRIKKSKKPIAKL